MNRWLGGLIMMACALLILSIILPSVGPRQAGPRTTCLNNQTNVAKAILNYAFRSNEVLPQLRGDVLIDDDRNPATVPLRAPWSVAILPEMDNRALFDALVAGSNARSPRSSIKRSFDEFTASVIGGYTCPNDPRHQSPGALSYVANAGYILSLDWEQADRLRDAPTLTSIDWRNDTATMQFDRLSDEDQDISQAAAVFFDAVASSRRNKLTNMYDGQTVTLLLTENLDAGGWADPALQSVGFGVWIEAVGRVPMEVGEVGGGQSRTLALQPGFSIGVSRVNSRSKSGERRPRPSSNHPGGVVVTFCDGRGTFLNENIDERVYAQLLTPSGSKYGQEVITQGQINGP